MNQRIKELALQAGFQYIKDEGIGWAGNHNASLPKFAELIVRECIEIVEGYCETSPEIMGLPLEILDHFDMESDQ